ncbi:hypothetical protein KUH03_26080 [Sphingobacterium sp. E70]|uniref:hypothetical protein n=1 Tax=Sphingobacterium sp. E70 TaxID=2853439 RepID=UPI00211D01E1|nr:hypothetical protein [Sphingobacterium sp. E70]ULT22765.1 hypothetical protein KUH03_26080 [Sphingobacterium sp. E70]
MQKVNIRNDDFGYGKMTWETFPELLEKNNIDWRFYQNETSCGGGLSGEERAWLSNFGCNLLEFFRPIRSNSKILMSATLQHRYVICQGKSLSSKSGRRNPKSRPKKSVLISVRKVKRWSGPKPN